MWRWSASTAPLSLQCRSGDRTILKKPRTRRGVAWIRRFKVLRSGYAGCSKTWLSNETQSTKAHLCTSDPTGARMDAAMNTRTVTVPRSVVFNGWTFFLVRGRYYCRGARNRKGPPNLHRAIWEDANGPVPDGCDIHHRDGNPLNNALDNLECIAAMEHRRQHSIENIASGIWNVATVSALGREAAKQWHASAEGRERHRQDALKRWGRPPIVFRCDRCDEPYEAPFKGRHRFCSPRCRLDAENERNRARRQALRQQ